MNSNQRAIILETRARLSELRCQIDAALADVDRALAISSGAIEQQPPVKRFVSPNGKVRVIGGSKKLGPAR